MASGENEKVSAVKIETGGGPSLIANTVFHSNSGDPLDAVNTNVVNCTFALNGGHLKLIDEREWYYQEEGMATQPFKDYPSGLYNSIIWRDDQANSETTSLERLKVEIVAGVNTYVAKNDMPMKYNAISKGDTNPTAKGDQYIADGTNVTKNALLHKTNKNVFLGPNFVDPKETFADGISYEDSLAQIVSRDFHINPSARFINNADSTTYLRLVPFYAEHSVQKSITVIKESVRQDPYIFQSVQRLDRPKTVVVDKVGHIYNPERLTLKNLKGTETEAVFPTQAKEKWYPFRRTTATTEDREGSEVTITDTVSDQRVPYVERELAFKYRSDGADMELGAYECAAALQRVLYVWEGSSETPDGSSWVKAFKKDDLQSAIDVASIYSTIGNERERAYVFVASDEDIYHQVVKIRDGVSVYGGVPGTFYDLAQHTDGKYSDNQINDYINLVNAARSMANASVSTIVGLESDENGSESTLGFMLDGFVLSAGTTDKTPFHPDKHLTVIKNCIITGNNVSGGKPVVKMDNGLLYNTLVFGNTVTSGTPVVQVNTDTHQAGVLNCTVVADHTGEEAINATATGCVVNTITYNEAEKSLSRGESPAAAFVSCNTAEHLSNMFAPYFRAGANSYELPTDFTSHRPLHYQLVETSPYINGGQAEATTIGTELAPTIFTPYDEFVNYTDIPSVSEDVGLAGDRDPLGNPRLLGTAPDVGCFETWYVNNNFSATNQTDIHHVNNYGGHKYPHRGSVVYVMGSGNLVVDTYDDPATGLVTETDPTFTGENALRPGYVLVKDGGSIYGQGNDLKFSYVAAEKSFAADAQYGLISMPFDYYLTATSAPTTFKAYAYDAEERSAYNYVFKSEDSDLWKEDLSAIQDEGKMKRTEGWLLEFDRKLTAGDNKNVRFTGWGAITTDYVYEEGSADKTVRLFQNDKRQAGTGSGLEFTRQEDMGWNLKGIPYLVSGYKTCDPDNPSGDNYNMNIPHVYYKMGGNGEYIPKGEGIIYTEQSWAGTAQLSLNEAFFTQTAVIGDYEAGVYTNQYEDLLFRHPVYSGSAPAYAMSRPLVWVRDMDGNGDLLTVDPDPEASKDVTYSFGRDGVKWMTLNAPQLYLLSKSNSRLSLLGAAPTETDLPLGIYVPDPDDSEPRNFIFSLPEPEAFKDYSHVWLIDRALNRVTNLLEANYAIGLRAGTDNSRFILRIGGFPYETMDGQREYIVYSWHRQLHIRGLIEGDQIRVYSASGQLVLSATASDPEFTAELPQAGGIYAVRVNDFSTKVRNL